MKRDMVLYVRHRFECKFGALRGIMRGAVYVVESPSARDLADGRTEGKALCEALELSLVESRYILAINREEFQRAFADVDPDNGFRVFQEEAGNLPAIHLSMHGNNDGIGLANGDFITWEELRVILRPLNERYGGLFLTFSTCSGARAEQIAHAFQPDHLPLFGLVGSVESVPWDEAVVGFIVFYHHFFRNKPANECVELMKAASGHTHFQVIKGFDLRAQGPML